MESEGKLPFLDVLVVRNEGDVKLQIYRKPTHTDQYLIFSSHHLIEHKLSVVWTLSERSQSLTSDSHDRQLEDAHVEKSLWSCGYPDWTFHKVKDQMRMKATQRKQINESENRRPIVLPYVKGTPERLARGIKKHRVPVSIRPVRTLRKQLVHPKDKQEKEEVTDWVYKIPCSNCEMTYIGETGRKFGTRLREHKTKWRQQQVNQSQEVSVHPVCQNRINQLWLIMQATTTM